LEDMLPIMDLPLFARCAGRDQMSGFRDGPVDGSRSNNLELTSLIADTRTGKVVRNILGCVSGFFSRIRSMD
jgi:hypothetical protein